MASTQATNTPTSTGSQNSVAKKKTLVVPQAKAASFNLVNQFYGYRSKEDMTTLPPGYLVPGSQNVLTTTEGHVIIRNGYELDGQTDSSIAPINSSYDWITHLGFNRNFRAGNGKLQVRYVASAGDTWNGVTFTDGQVYWVDLVTGLPVNSIYEQFNFTPYWDTTEQKQLILWVNNQYQIDMWSGGMATLASFSNTAISFTGTSALLATGLNIVDSATASTFTFNNIAGIAGNGSLVFGSNPVNGETLHVTIQGTTSGDFYINFVDTIGSTAGNVLIGSTTADTITNLLGLFNAPGTTNTTQVALSTANQALVGYLTYTSTKTMTLNGTSTWAQLGFLGAGTRSVIVYGITYTYTGGEGTSTIFGLGTDPTVDNPPVQSLIIQSVRTTLNGTMGLPSINGVTNKLISCFRNQIYIGCNGSNDVYISKVNDYTNYSFTTPVRVVGEGALLTLDDVPNAFAPQESSINIFAGNNWIYTVNFTLSSSNSDEAISVVPLKSSPLVGSQSQAMTAKVLNDVVFISAEPVLTSLGRVALNLATPQTINLSDPIKPEFSAYDFTNASVAYNKYNIYLALPAENIFLIYSLANGWWEAPQIGGFSRFSTIDGQLYSHSSQSPISYKMNVGYNDAGNPINAIAAFSYQSYGDRGHKKNFNELYFEGYLSSNTNLTMGNKYDFGGFNGISQKNLIGTDISAIFATTTDGSLGKNPLGSNPLGSITDSPSNTPKLRKIFTYAPLDFFEHQIFFQTNDVDQQWEILTFGANVRLSESESPEIKT